MRLAQWWHGAHGGGASGHRCRHAARGGRGGSCGWCGCGCGLVAHQGLLLDSPPLTPNRTCPPPLLHRHASRLAGPCARMRHRLSYGHAVSSACSPCRTGTRCCCLWHQVLLFVAPGVVVCGTRCCCLWTCRMQARAAGARHRCCMPVCHRCCMPEWRVLRRHATRRHATRRHATCTPTPHAQHHTCPSALACTCQSLHLSI